MAKARSPQPAGKPAAIVQSATKARDLVLRDRSALEPRLSAGFIDGLAADVVALGGLSAEAPRARSQSRVATLTQDQAIARGIALVKGIRDVVKAHHASAEIRRAYGVGTAATARTVKATRAVIEAVLARAASKPEEARAAGVLDSDLDALRSALAMIIGADADQENTRAAAPATTRARNEAARRLEDAVRRIAAAGQLQFVNDATRQAEYAALSAKSSKAKPKGGTPPVG